MKNHGFYSKILAMSMLLGQVTPVAQAVNTESNIPGMYTANPFAHLMETEEKAETKVDSVVKNDESDTETKEAEIGTAETQASSQSGTEEVGTMTVDAIEEVDLFADADTSWYNEDKDTFLLDNAEELLGFSQLVCDGNSFSGKTITLNDTIDLSELGTNWVPIGNDGTNKKEFQGTFDGNQMKIKHLTIDAEDASQQGLFYYVGKNAVVKNVILTDVAITAQSIVGGISALNYGTIQNCAVMGEITAKGETPDQGSSIGGLVGKNLETGSIVNCYNQSAVTGVSKVGGIVGVTETQTTLANVYNVGEVTAESKFGSLVGDNAGGISYSYWLAEDGVSATGTSTVSLTDCASFDEEGTLTPDSGNEEEEDEESTDEDEESTEDDEESTEDDEESTEDDEESTEDDEESTEDDEESTEDDEESTEDDEESSEDEDDLEGIASKTAGAVYVITEDDGKLLTRMNAWVQTQSVMDGYYTWQTTGSDNFPTFYEAYTHSWEYSITEADDEDETKGYITATCVNSGDVITLTVQDDLTYLGKEFEFWDLFSAKVESDDNLSLNDFDLQEVFALLNYGPVKNADDYAISISGTTEELEFTVAKKELSLVWTGTSFKYDGETHIPTAEASGLVGEDIGGDEIALDITVEATQDGDEDSNEVGDYQATATLLNYYDNYAIAEEHEIHDYSITALEVFTVNFYSNGDVFHTVTVTETDEEKTISAPADPDRGENFKFGGWYTTVAYNVTYDFSKEVTGDLDLYAKWSELFTVTFDYDDDGVTPDSTTTVWEGDTLAKPSDPVRGDDVFEGWYYKVSTGGLGTAYNFNQTVSGNLSLIANWKTIYTATFHHNDEDNTITTQQSLSGTTLTAPSNPTRENYVFGGWYQDEACETVWNFTYETLDSNVDLYAKWTRQYTVTFDSQGGSSVISKKALEDGLVTAPGQPTYTEFYFMGWYTDTTFTTEWNFATDLVKGDMTLYALWEAFPAFTVTFETNGGTAVEQQVILSEELVEEPDSPVLTGYTFLGWYSDAELLLPWDFENDIVTKQMTLYAKWQKVVYLTYGHVYDYNGNGLIGTQVYLYQNGKQIANSQADINGYFTFSDVSEGVYNIMYTIGTKTITTAIEVFYQEHQELADVFMPEFTVSSTVSISSQTSIHAVSGLYETTSYLTESQGYYDTYAIDLAVSSYVNEQESALIENVMSPYDRIIEFFDVSITTDKNSLGANSLDGTANLIQIVMEIPWQYRNNDTFRVYRLHNDTLDTITSTPNSIGEYIEVSSNGKFISIYTKNFSTYALAYTADSKYEEDFQPGDQNGSDETRIYNVSTRYRLNGNETTDSSMGGVSYNTSFPVYGTTVVVTPKVNYGYEVDYVTAVSDAGESLQVTRSNDGSFRFVQGLSPVTVTLAYVSSRVQTNTQQFADVFPADSYFNAVNRVVDAGLMTGTGNGIFSPHGTITRGMLVTILYNLSGERYDGTASFLDVMENDYFATAVAWAQDNDVVMGYNDNTFRPNQGITREEIAVIYYSYASYTNTQGNDWVYPTEYTDNAQIGAWAKTAVAWCYGKGILDARFDNLFFPQSFGTRAEVAVSLLPML